MNDKNASQRPSRDAFDDVNKVVTEAFIGFMGGSTLGIDFGIWGLLLGGLFGSALMGYFSYKSIYKHPSRTKSKKGS